jgi:hypothetical protein
MGRIILIVVGLIFAINISAKVTRVVDTVWISNSDYLVSQSIDNLICTIIPKEWVISNIILVDKGGDGHVKKR